ncbi:MAG: L,D-transpeptidase family protein [Gammaproteobacteria bacterium]|nr:L,D-transpeptidase family protein [Gammaproteobacteria bacterium]
MRPSRTLLLAATLAASLVLPGLARADETELPLQALVRTLSEDRAHPQVDWRGAERHLEDVSRFYAGRGWDLAWSRDGQPTAQVRDVLDELRAVANKGLDPDDYSGLRLTYLLIDLMTTPSSEQEDWALWDVAVSASVARYLSDLHFGRIDPAEVGMGLRIDRSAFDVAGNLAVVAGSGNPRLTIAEVEPNFRTYENLKRVLARYRALSLEPGLGALPPLPAESKSLKPGDAWIGTAALRRLLVALGDLAPSAPQATGSYDESLAAGVRAFQSRHGLAADGAIGPGTFKALTTPLASRARQIELSLERWRWVPQQLSTPPIVVNIPQFKLYAFQDTTDDVSRMLTMDVVVGSAYREQLTPVFAADMSYLVFSPYWDVPRSIAVKEILPKARRNRAWLARNGYQIVRGYGDNAPALKVNAASLSAVASGTARIRQKPGPKNSLGRVKFMLPNRYNVYLHDTPADSLFARTRRDFSHGCVRLADPAALARHVLRDDPSWTPERIEASMSGTTPETVRLAQPIRVYFVYATALASNDKAYFFEDIYGHDALLDVALRQDSR